MLLRHPPIRVATWALAVVFTHSTITVAQDSCEGILKDGIWEYEQNAGSVKQTSSFLNWFCSKTYSNYKEAREAGLKLGIVYEGIPIEIGGNYSESQWSEFRNETCRYESGGYIHAQEFTEFARRASKDIVKAWENCTTAFGTRAWIVTTENPNAFALQLRRRADQGPSNFTVAQISVTSGD